MPNNTISQVKVNGTTYDICDASTRDTLSQLQQDVTDLKSSVANVDSKLTFWGNGNDANTSTKKLIHGGYTEGMEFVSHGKNDMTNWVRFYNNYMQYQHRENGQWVPKWTLNPLILQNLGFAGNTSAFSVDSWDTGFQLNIYTNNNIRHMLVVDANTGIQLAKSVSNGATQWLWQK